MARVLAAAQAQVAAGLELSAAVAQARAAGHTWAELGDLLGMSRQAAFKRFGHVGAPLATGGARTVQDRDEAARAAFADLDAGRIERLRARMSPETADALTAERLRTTWASAVHALGPWQSTELLGIEQGERTHVDPRDRLVGSLVVSLALHHERGAWHGRVAYDAADRLIGLLVLPPGAPAPF